MNIKMKINVLAKPRSKKEGVEELDDGSYAVSVKEPPVNGAANYAVLMILAEYFKVPISRVRLVGGYGSRHKIVEII